MEDFIEIKLPYGKDSSVKFKYFSQKNFFISIYPNEQSDREGNIEDMNDFFDGIEQRLPFLVGEKDWRETKEQIESMYISASANIFELDGKGEMVCTKLT